MAIASSVHVHSRTDSKSRFDIIRNGRRKSEKRLMIDVYAERQGNKEQDINNIDLVWSNQNIADGLIKAMNQEKLRYFITNGKLSIRVEQWILHKPKNRKEEGH